VRTSPVNRQLQTHDPSNAAGVSTRFRICHDAASSTPIAATGAPILSVIALVRRATARSRSWTASEVVTVSSVVCSTQSSRAGRRRSGFSSVGRRCVGNHVLTDYAQPTDEEQIWDIWRQRARETVVRSGTKRYWDNLVLRMRCRDSTCTTTVWYLAARRIDRACVVCSHNVPVS
jgi:hypothetical protein